MQGKEIVGIAPQNALLLLRLQLRMLADSTSVNLFKVLVAALRMNKGRRVILGERGDFPTDVYIASGVAELPGSELRCVEPEEVLDAITDEVAIDLLTHVNYKSGRRYDVAKITQRAHEVGALVVWDLCHSVGAMPVYLDKAQVDFAVGCTYKYLNGARVCLRLSTSSLI